MVHEDPGDSVAAREMRGEGFDTKGLGCVVATVKNVQSELFGQSIGPMRAFACNESVDSFRSGELEFGTRASGYDSDASADFRPGRDHERGGTENKSQFLRQLCARDSALSLKTDMLTVIEKERFRILQPESCTQLDVIAEFRMKIQGQMRTVNREVVFQK